MDDLSQRLEALLNSPDSLAKLQGALAALGVEPDGASSPAPSVPSNPPPSAAPTSQNLRKDTPSPETAKTPTAAASSMPDLSSLAGLLPLLSKLGSGDSAFTSAEVPETSPSIGGGLDPAMLKKLLPLLQGLGGSGSDGTSELGGLMKLLPLLSGGGQEDENTALLRALRPHLHGEREKRLDGAIKLLQISRVLPLLK